MSSGLSTYIALRSPNELLREHSLVPGKNTLGRHADCEIVVNDGAASREHAEIFYDIDTNSITVKDLNSTNGTFVNGKKISQSHHIEMNDILRIGGLLISFLPTEATQPQKKPQDITKSIVTGELVLESIDNYSVLLHDIGTQLINVPELPEALEKISELLTRIIGAEECVILMLEQTEEVQAADIPPEIFKELVEEKTAIIFDSRREDSEKKDDTRGNYGGYRLVAPVQIDEKAVAIISAKKMPSADFPFNNSDLQVVIAVSHQVALAIQRSRLEAKLLYNASHDSLTGLPNRSVFIDRLNQALEMSKRKDDYDFAVMFVDIDNFKMINDNFGHEIGDQLLIELSSRLDKNLRGTDTVSQFGSVARFGGDEFAILLAGLMNDIDVFLVARRVCAIAAIPFQIDDHNLEITVSVGLTTNKMEYEEPEEMLRDADIAMYRAKESGKNRFELYDKDFHNQLIQRLEIEKSIKNAHESQEFQLHYQPIISLKSGKIVGHEALLRWYTPDRGIVSPHKFISPLDRFNLLTSIDQWGFREACLQTMRWVESFPSIPQLLISANFSAKNFLDLQIVDYIRQILEETKLPPESIWIEITEDVGLDISDISLDILNQIQAMGIHICIDDFGTGYSALNYLIDLPIHSLKIDTSIIHRIDEAEESRKITKAIVLLAKQFDLEIVAEGIENERQHSLVTSLDIDYAQGFLFGKAVPVEEARKLLELNKVWN